MRPLTRLDLIPSSNAEHCPYTSQSRVRTVDGETDLSEAAGMPEERMLTSMNVAQLLRHSDPVPLLIRLRRGQPARTLGTSRFATHAPFEQ